MKSPASYGLHTCLVLLVFLLPTQALHAAHQDQACIDACHQAYDPQIDALNHEIQLLQAEASGLSNELTGIQAQIAAAALRHTAIQAGYAAAYATAVVSCARGIRAVGRI